MIFKFFSLCARRRENGEGVLRLWVTAARELSINRSRGRGKTRAARISFLSPLNAPLYRCVSEFICPSCRENQNIFTESGQLFDHFLLCRNCRFRTMQQMFDFKVLREQECCIFCNFSVKKSLIMNQMRTVSAPIDFVLYIRYDRIPIKDESLNSILFVFYFWFRCYMLITFRKYPDEQPKQRRI